MAILRDLTCVLSREQEIASQALALADAAILRATEKARMNPPILPPLLPVGQEPPDNRNLAQFLAKRAIPSNFRWIDGRRVRLRGYQKWGTR